MIVSKSIQKAIIKQIHQKSHLGINKCINRLKDVFFWSGMRGQIMDIISQCSICNEFRGTLQKGPIILDEIPTKPSKKCATYLFDTYIVIANSSK